MGIKEDVRAAKAALMNEKPHFPERPVLYAFENGSWSVYEMDTLRDEVTCRGKLNNAESEDTNFPENLDNE